MALSATTIYPLARMNSVFFTATGTSRNISAATHWVGGNFQAPETGTITEVHFRTGTVSSPVFTLEAGITAVDANGFPLGTDVSVADAVTNPAATTNYSATGLSASVTRGSHYGIIVRVKAATFTSGSANIVQGVNADWTGTTYPLNYGGAMHNTGSDSKAASPSMVVPKYSTGWAGSMYFLPPRVGGGSVSTSTTSGNVVGNKFTIDQRMRVAGYWVAGEIDGSVNIEMYAGSDNTAITNSAFAPTVAYRTGTGFEAAHVFMLATPVTLEPGTYRVGVRNTSTTANSLYHATTMPDSTAVEMLSLGGRAWMKSTYASSAWTDTDTALCGITPLVTAIDDGRPWASYAAGIG